MTDEGKSLPVLCGSSMKSVEKPVSPRISVEWLFLLSLTISLSPPVFWKPEECLGSSGICYLWAYLLIFSGPFSQWQTDIDSSSLTHDSQRSIARPYPPLPWTPVTSSHWKLNPFQFSLNQIFRLGASGMRSEAALLSFSLPSPPSSFSWLIPLFHTFHLEFLSSQSLPIASSLPLPQLISFPSRPWDLLLIIRTLVWLPIWCFAASH